MAGQLRILEGATFCICDEVGDLHHEGEGLFSEDTRFLSRFRLTINGKRPLLLSSGKIEYFSAAFFMRNPLAGGLDQDVLSIRRERFVVREQTEEIVDGARASISDALARFPSGRKPDAALLWSCATRRFLLGTRTGREVEIVRDTVGADTPVAGFYCLGEIAPIVDGDVSQFHNATMVAVLLGAR